MVGGEKLVPKYYVAKSFEVNKRSHLEIGQLYTSKEEERRKNIPVLFIIYHCLHIKYVRTGNDNKNAIF
jgi:hypothetical protein